MEKWLYIAVLLAGLYAPHATADAWKPFLPEYQHRSHQEVMEEYGGFDSLRARVFLHQVRMNLNLPSTEATLSALSDSEKIETLPCASAPVDTVIARISLPSGMVGYRHRAWEDGEMCVFYDGVPVYSTYCGNPLRSMSQRKFLVRTQPKEPETVTSECVAREYFATSHFGVSGGQNVTGASLLSYPTDAFFFQSKDQTIDFPITYSGGWIDCR